MIQYPARNSLDSGNTPSVMGSPLLPARTSLASWGQLKPSDETNTPESFSSLPKDRMNATLACKSCFDHRAYSSNSVFLAFIIKMYFILLGSFLAIPPQLLLFASRQLPRLNRGTAT